MVSFRKEEQDELRDVFWGVTWRDLSRLVQAATIVHIIVAHICISLFVLSPTHPHLINPFSPNSMHYSKNTTPSTWSPSFSSSIIILPAAQLALDKWVVTLRSTCGTFIRNLTFVKEPLSTFFLYQHGRNRFPTSRQLHGLYSANSILHSSHPLSQPILGIYMPVSRMFL